jgi:Ca-activated chloride channel family protein
MNLGNRVRALGRSAGLVVFVAVWIGTCALAVTNRPAKPPDLARGAPDSSCTGVVLVSSQEKSELLAKLAYEYDQDHRASSNGCVDVRVNTLASGTAELALARGWTTSDGPQPTVWTPAATSWLRILRHDATSSDKLNLLPDDAPSLMQSPLVLAMPRPMAEALGWPNTPVGWVDVLKLAQDPDGWGRYGHPEWGRFRLGKTSPVQSTSGLHALAATYYAATGLSADLTAADLTDPKVLEFVRGVEASVLHYGNTVSGFFDTLRVADGKGAALSYVSAIATEEKQVLDYNAGKPRTPLVAVYPKDGTMVADHPYAVLNAPWVEASEQAAARDFLTWLQEPERQKRFLIAGFRDSTGHVASDLGLKNGIVREGPAVVLHPPSPAVLDLVRKSWENVRKRARVLLVFDVSGSMLGDKLDAAKAAAVAVLDVFAPDDKIGLWSFATDIRRLDPIDLIGPHKSQLIKSIDALDANGNTALYRATDSAVREVHATWDPARVNAVVVLTDGQNSDLKYWDRDALLRYLSNQPSSTPVPVFTIGYGQDADKETLTRIAQASGGRSYAAPDPAHIGSVFADVVSNF